MNSIVYDSIVTCPACGFSSQRGYRIMPVKGTTNVRIAISY